MTARGGRWRAAGRYRASAAALALAAACLPQAVAARSSAFSVPATTLDAALTTLARTAGIEIISTEPDLRRVRTRAVRGATDPRAALDRLLDGTGYRAVALSAGQYRIVRVATPPVRGPAPLPRTAPAPIAGADIVVTASKQSVSLLRYPGSLTVVEREAALPTRGTGSVTDLAIALPILQSTQLGAGRDKVFIRGIADSSFNGSTQATASLYLDDVQLNYTGLDPGLRLYDIKSIEVLEGPQGTLYGAGAIGGVIRLTSNPIDLAHTERSVAAGVTATRSGEPGFDVSGMLNLPLAADTLGVRAVAYRVRDGGYIDDVGRGRSDVNRTDTLGGRAGVRFEPGGGWRVELSGAGQRIDTRDGQYADRTVGPLARRAPISQPFDNNVLLGRLVLAHDWDSGLRLFSATGVVAYHSTDRFDATAPPPPGAPPISATYTSVRDKLLLSQEVRLSRSLGNGNSWVGGFTLIRDRDILSRAVGSPGMEAEIIGVTNVTKAASGFGEGTLALTHRLSATLGARFTSARSDGEPSSTPRATNFVRGRLTRRFDPTIAASWLIAPRLAVFARYQSGYRTGGLAVARGIGRVADYQADSIVVSELGARKLRSGPTGIALSGSVSLARWHGIQADLINRRGQPYTANIGDARIAAVEGNVDWVPIPGLRAAASFLVTDNAVLGPVAAQSKRDNRRLPETPPVAGHVALSYDWRSGAAQPRVGVTADYVGRSVLGIGDLFDVSQGNYVVVGVTSGVRIGDVDVSFVVDNLTNRIANRFAFGNPFTLASRDQTTPLRPVNARLGVSVAW